MKRLTNEDVEKKYGFPKKLKIDGTYTGIIFAPKRKLKNDNHWTCYIYDRNLQKQAWREIDKEENINAAKTLSKNAAEIYYEENKDKKPTTKQNKNISDFIVSNIIEKYTEDFADKQYKKVNKGKKLKSTVNAHIASKESNAKAINSFFGKKDIRQLTDSHFKRFMETRLNEVKKGSIGNSLSLFSTALNHTLKRNAKYRSRHIKEVNAELSRLIVVIGYFREDNDLTVKDILKESKENKTNGHGRIEYFKFKEIIAWLRNNDKIDEVFPDFFETLYWQANRVGEASKLKGKNIIIGEKSVKLEVPSILTKTGQGGIYSLHHDVEDIFRRRKENIQNEDYIFSVVNSKTHERQEMTAYFYRKVWNLIKVKFDLRLKDGRFMTPHVLRHSCINNIGDSMRANVQKFTNQSDAIVKHYMNDETQNKNELFRLLAWQDEMEKEVMRQDTIAGDKKMRAIEVAVDKI
jgi:integrase